MTGMTSIVKTAAHLMVGLMFVFGVYVIVHGHLTPGGGFAGGVVMAGAWILRVLAFGLPDPAARQEGASRIESVGILGFWALGLLGLVAGGVYFLNVLGVGAPFTLPSAGLVPYLNIAVGIEVAAALVCIYAALLLVRREEEA